MVGIYPSRHISLPPREFGDPEPWKNYIYNAKSCVLMHSYAGRRGLVVGRPTAVREDPGSNLIAAGRVYHDSHCDIQPWARVVHPYCSA